MKRPFLFRASLAALVRSVRSSPLAWILAVQVAMHLVGVGWGLPSSDGWDNDGVAPRDFLAGIAQTVSPGQYFRYPPVHLALLAILTSPVSCVALMRARSLAAPDVVSEIIGIPYMTFFSVVARLVTVAMAAGVVWALAKTGEKLAGKRAGLWTAAIAGISVPLVYYGQTSNLDVPCLFWVCLAQLAAVDAIVSREPARLRSAALFAAIAIGTKDQAYAFFLIAVPAGLALCAAVDPETWARPRSWSMVGRAMAQASGLLLLVDGPLYNPQGFRQRLLYLTGPASMPFAPYSNDAKGRVAVLVDVVARVVSSYPLPLTLAVAVGIGLALREVRNAGFRFAAGLVPLLGVLSFTLAFNCIARRADHRFVLPQVETMSVYGGWGVDFLLGAARSRWAQRTSIVAAFATMTWAVVRAADVEVNVLGDPRYDAEAWMRARVGPGEHVETYGLNAYLPRFPGGAHVERVAMGGLAGRSPLPGVDEVVGALEDVRERRARFLVVPEAWAGRYLADLPEHVDDTGRIPASSEVSASLDLDSRAFFRTLRDHPGTHGYHLVHTSRWDHAPWPPLDIHASTARTVWIYERD